MIGACRGLVGCRFRIVGILLIWCLTGIVSDAQTSHWPTENPPPPLLAPDIQFPDYELERLDNRAAGRRRNRPGAARGQHSTACARGFVE